MRTALLLCLLAVSAAASDAPAGGSGASDADLAAMLGDTASRLLGIKAG